MMPSKKKRYNARFPAGRIKKIMQTDDDVGKVAQAVPVIISRALELFVESLLSKAVEVTNAKNAKTLTPSHLRQCILSESRFDFLKDLVSNISEVNPSEDDVASPNSVPPPVYLGLKRQRGSGIARLNRRSSSTSPSTTSLRQRKRLTASQPTTPTTPLTPVSPLFFKEIGSGVGDNIKKEVSVIRPPVIQHTGPSQTRLPTDDSGEEETETDEEVNGFDNVTNHSTRPLLIDDDYDT